MDDVRYWMVKETAPKPLIIGPAGTMHMSVLDFAKWVAWQAGKGKRAPPWFYRTS